MRTSDGMVLGLGLIKFSPDTWGFDRCGCLIFADYVAQTGEFSMAEVELAARLRPWYRELRQVPERLHEFGPRFIYEGQQLATVFVIISEWAWLLDEGHVTLDEVIAWVRANEPSEAVDLDDEPLFAQELERRNLEWAPK